MFKFSIIICCYNSADRLPPTLSALKALNLGKGLEIEIIIVDNNCEDDTAEVVTDFRSRGPSLTIKYVYEDRPGLSFARDCGFKHATGNVFVLVDDDNQLDPNYLTVLHSVFKAHPKVGIVGGIGSLPDDQKVPDWFTRYQGRYALGPTNGGSGPVDCVYGAGMAIRREVLSGLRKLNFQSHLTDRSGNSLSSGGDSELCFAARLLGWTIWRAADARFIHAIPDNRMTEDYLLRLTEGIGQSIPNLSIYIYYLRFRSRWKVCFVSFLSFCKNCLAWVFWFYIKQGDSLTKKECSAIYSSILVAWSKLLLSRAIINTLRTVEMLDARSKQP